MIRRHESPLMTAPSLCLNFRALAALSLWGGLFFRPIVRDPMICHRERRVASIIVTALAAAKIPTNKK
jgi:hypothetical protein